ncbi:MAG: HNH endonuclease signature motif containing protein [Bdellovibrionota bacterium]
MAKQACQSKSQSNEYDLKAVNLANHYLESEAKLLSHLIEMRKKKHFIPLNYTGIFDYCERRLHLSRAQAYYFKTVAEKADEVPEIKQAVLTGELTLSQARRIVPVLTKTNHKQWIKKAKELPQKDLEREVTAVNPQAHVRERIRWVAKELSELKVSLSPEAAANLAALQNILSQKLHKAATMGDVIAWALHVARKKHDPVEKARRSTLSARKTGSNSAVRKMAQSAARPATPPPPNAGLIAVATKKPRFASQGNRTLIPAGVKHAVILRDQMQCTFVAADGKRCQQQRWIHLHHIKEWNRGGLHEIGNLRLLCRAHHALEHSRNKAH